MLSPFKIKLAKNLLWIWKLELIYNFIMCTCVIYAYYLSQSTYNTHTYIYAYVHTHAHVLYVSNFEEFIDCEIMPLGKKNMHSVQTIFF